MEFEKICRVLYKYEPVEEGELALEEEEAIVYIWDSSNPEWWSASLEMGQTADEVSTGLIPYNYVEEMEHLGKARALYSYEALNPDELSFEENAEFFIYQKEGQDWLMVYFNNKYGFVPQSYVEEIQEDGNEDVGGYVEYEAELDVPTSESAPSIVSPVVSTPVMLDSKTTTKPLKDDMLFWRVAEVDKKKKNKKKVRLGISSDTLFIGSEEDKATPVRQWPISEVKKYGIKNKHIIIELSGSKSGTFDFSCSSIKQAEAVAFKIRSCSKATYDDKSANKGSGGWFGKFKKKSSTPKAPPVKLNQGSMNNDFRSEQRFIQEKNASSPLPDLPHENTERRSNNVNRYNPTPSGENKSSTPSGLPRTEPVKTPQMVPTKSPKPLAREEMEGEIAIVLYNFTGAEEDELSVQAEERINVIDKTSDSQWWRCRVYYDNGQFKEGLVPSDYVSLASSENNNSSKTPSASKEVSTGPQTDKLREWTDATGSFKVEAEFLRYEDGKIHLHKANGVRIAVPLEKMCAIDVHFVSEATGEDLSSNLTEVKRAKAEASRWKEFFVLAGITASDADTYASTFTREKIDRLLLKEIDRSTLKGLGLTEGDAIRVEKAAQSSAISKAPKQKRSVTFGNNTVVDSESDEVLALRLQREENNRHRKDLASSDLRDYQIEQDELLARKLQEENDPTGSWQNFSSKSDQSNKKYGLGLGSSKGSGKGKQNGVNFDTLFEASAKLEEENKRSQSHKKDVAPLVTSKSNKSSGFDDEIWGAPSSRPAPRQPSRTSSFDAFSKSSTGVDPWQPFSDKPTIPEPVEKPVFGTGSLSKKDPKSRNAIEDSWSAVKANFEKQQPTTVSTQSQTNVSKTSPQLAVNKNVFNSTNTAALPQPLIPIPKGSTSSVFIPTRRPPPPKPVSNVFADAKSVPVVTGGLTTRTGAASPAPNTQTFGNNQQVSNLFSSNPSNGTQGPFNVPEALSTNTGNSLFTSNLGFVDNQGTIASNPNSFQNTGFLSNNSNLDVPNPLSSNNISFEYKNNQPTPQNHFNLNPGASNLFSSTSNYQPSSLGSRTNNQFDELSLEKLGLKSKPSSQRAFSDSSSFQPPRASSVLGGGFGVDSIQPSSQLDNTGSFTNFSSTANVGTSSHKIPSSSQSYQTGYLSGIGDSRSLGTLASQIHSNNNTNFSSNLNNGTQFKSFQNPSTFSSNSTQQNQPLDSNFTGVTGSFSSNLKTDSFTTEFNTNSLSSFNQPASLSNNFISSQTNRDNPPTSYLNPSAGLSNMGSSLNENSLFNLGSSLNSGVGSSNYGTTNSLGIGAVSSNNYQAPSKLGNPQLLSSNNFSSSLSGLSLGSSLNNNSAFSGVNPSRSIGLGSQTYDPLGSSGSLGLGSQTNNLLNSSNNQSLSYGQSNHMYGTSSNPTLNTQLGFSSTKLDQPSSYCAPGYGYPSSQLSYSTSSYGQSSSQSGHGTSGYGQSSSQSGYGTSGYDQSSSQSGYGTSGYGQPSTQSGYGASGYGQPSTQSGYGTSLSSNQQEFPTSFGQTSTFQNGYGTTGFNQNSNQQQGYGYNQGR